MNVIREKYKPKEAQITCGIYLYSTRTKNILVCHATNARWNQWSIPKGLKENHEQPFEVAARELMEETGVSVNDLHIIMRSPLPSVKYQKQNKILESFLVVTDSSLENVKFKSSRIPGKSFGEIDSWKWISIYQAGTWLHESQQNNLKFIEELLETYKPRN